MMRRARIAGMFGVLLAVAFVVSGPVNARAVNISNAWILPEEGFPVFYRYFRDPISWYEADAVCQFHHANLVTVDSTAQYDATRAYLKELDIVNNVWIGLIKSKSNGDFTWTERREYRSLEKNGGHWAEAVPESVEPLCAAADPVSDFQWHARHCGGPDNAAFICELPVPSRVEGCMLTSLPSLTVIYLPEQNAVELTSDCGLGGTKNIVCKGNADHDDMVKQLSCGISPEDFDDSASSSTVNSKSSWKPASLTTEPTEHIERNSILTESTRPWSWSSKGVDSDEYDIQTRHRRETQHTDLPPTLAVLISSTTEVSIDSSIEKEVDSKENGEEISGKLPNVIVLKNTQLGDEPLKIDDKIDSSFDKIKLKKQDMEKKYMKNKKMMFKEKNDKHIKYSKVPASNIEVHEYNIEEKAFETNSNDEENRFVVPKSLESIDHTSESNPTETGPTKTETEGFIVQTSTASDDIKVEEPFEILENTEEKIFRVFNSTHEKLKAILPSDIASSEKTPNQNTPFSEETVKEELQSSLFTSLQDVVSSSVSPTVDDSHKDESLVQEYPIINQGQLFEPVVDNSTHFDVPLNETASEASSPSTSNIEEHTVSEKSKPIMEEKEVLQTTTEAGNKIDVIDHGHKIIEINIIDKTSLPSKLHITTKLNKRGAAPTSVKKDGENLKFQLPAYKNIETITHQPKVKVDSESLKSSVSTEKMEDSRVIMIDPKLSDLNNNTTRKNNDSEPFPPAAERIREIDVEIPEKIKEKERQVQQEQEDNIRKEFLPTPLRQIPDINRDDDDFKKTENVEDRLDGTSKDDELNSESSVRPNRGRLLTRSPHHSYYPYFFSRVLG